jgi:hypothetical protein
MNRCEEHGWVKIGITCSAGRRSLWFRENYRSDWDGNVRRFEQLESFELCAGREGADAYVKFENNSSLQVYDLWNVLTAARFASET